MIGYGDKTWCTAQTCTKFQTCDRAYTPKVREDANKWWGGPDAPVCLYYAPEEHLDCYEQQPKEEK